MEKTPSDVRMSVCSASASAVALAAALALLGCEQSGGRADISDVHSRPSRSYPGGYGDVPTRVSESVASSAMDQRPDDPALSRRGFPGVASRSGALASDAPEPAAWTEPIARPELSESWEEARVSEPSGSWETEPVEGEETWPAASSSRSRPGFASAAPAATMKDGRVDETGARVEREPARTSRAFPGSALKPTPAPAEPIEPALPLEPAWIEPAEATVVSEAASAETPESTESADATPVAAWNQDEQPVELDFSWMEFVETTPPAPSERGGAVVFDLSWMAPVAPMPKTFGEADAEWIASESDATSEGASSLFAPRTSRAFPGHSPKAPVDDAFGNGPTEQAWSDRSSRAFPGRTPAMADADPDGDVTEPETTESAVEEAMLAEIKSPDAFDEWESAQADEAPRTSRAFPGRAPEIPSEALASALPPSWDRAFPGGRPTDSDELPAPSAVVDEPMTIPAMATAEVSLRRYRPSRSYPGGHWAPRAQPPMSPKGRSADKASEVAGVEADEE